MVEKSRNLSLVEFYSLLQLEWISYFVRSKIYKRDFADYYKKICKDKKEKIFSISRKNCLPNIFEDKNYLQKYLDQFLVDFGIPEFQYKDDKVKNKMSPWDRFYYFDKGVSVKFIRENKIEMGEIVYNDKKNSIVTVKSDDFDELYDLHYNNVCRLFPSDFFDIE